MSDRARQLFRTIYPIFLGALASLLVTAAARWAGVELDSQLAQLIVTGLTISALYWLGSRLEKSDNSIAAWLGRLLISFGMDLGTPTYTPPDPEPTTNSRFRS